MGFILHTHTHVIQVFNYCLVGRGLTPYDLLWPVSKRLDASVEAKVVEGTTTNHMTSRVLFLVYLAFQTDDVSFRDSLVFNG